MAADTLIEEGQSLLQFGRPNEAFAKARLAQDKDPQNPDCAALLIKTLLALEDFAGAEATFRVACATFPNHVELLTKIFENWKEWTAGIQTARRECEAEPDNFDMWDMWVGCLLATQRPSEALSVIVDGLKRFDSPPSAFRLRVRETEARLQLSDVVGTIDALVKAHEQIPDHEETLERLCYLLLTSRQHAGLAQPFQARLRAIQARSLPDRLSDGLASIWERTDDIELDEAAMEWAWELADKSLWERQAWTAAAAWGKEAHLLLRRWWETQPAGKLQQLADLVQKPDMSSLFAASVERGGCILASAHVGPTAAALPLFVLGNTPFRTIGSPDRNRDNEDTLIPVMPDSHKTMRKVVGQLRAGATLAIMADGASYTRNSLAIQFLGRPVELPAQVPKMIRRYNAASFWCCPLWKDGRIVVELEKLPDPIDDETSEDWAHRWFKSYLARLEAVMRGPPENLVLFSGIWANVNLTAINERRRHRKQRPAD